MLVTVLNGNQLSESLPARETSEICSEGDLLTGKCHTGDEQSYQEENQARHYGFAVLLCAPAKSVARSNTVFRFSFRRSTLDATVHPKRGTER